MLKRLKGRFILSLNDAPETRALFDWADIEAVETRYTANAIRRAREVLISGGGGG